MTRDAVDLNQIPQVVRDYTQFQDKRCAMPALSDVYGLYYNKQMLADAGYTEPPKTLAELDEMAKKLTKRDADGNIEVAGFVPSNGFYENAPAHFAPAFGATWLKEDGTSNIASDPGWAQMLTWQKGLSDWYGYDELKKFASGLGQEFSADNAFQAGKVAMMIDGEYRNAFIKDEAADLDYGTAPFPVAPDKVDLYGSGYLTGNVLGIGRGAQNPEAAWALVKYLSTDTEAVVDLANAIKNVPTTTPALESPNLEKDANYQTFLDVFANPSSSTTPATESGKAYQDTFSTFVNDYLAGKKTDLPGWAGRGRPADQRPDDPRRGSVTTATVAVGSGARPAPTARRRRIGPAGRRRVVIASMLAPWFLGVLIFFVYPLIDTIYLSFTRYDLLSPPKWVGLNNYRFMFTKDPQIGQATYNTPG